MDIDRWILDDQRVTPTSPTCSRNKNKEHLATTTSTWFGTNVVEGNYYARLDTTP